MWEQLYQMLQQQRQQPTGFGLGLGQQNDQFRQALQMALQRVDQPQPSPDIRLEQQGDMLRQRMGQLQAQQGRAFGLANNMNQIQPRPMQAPRPGFGMGIQPRPMRDPRASGPAFDPNKARQMSQMGAPSVDPAHALQAQSTGMTRQPQRPQSQGRQLGMQQRAASLGLRRDSGGY